MRRALWPGPDDHPGETAAFFDAGRGLPVVFVADREAGERWARELGHTEMVGDAAPDNEISLRAHEALGFVETDGLVCFRKRLGAGWFGDYE